MNWQNAALALAGVDRRRNRRGSRHPDPAAHGQAHRGAFRERRADRPPRSEGWCRCSLHFSTIVWFLGGLALIAAALWFEQDARLATGLFVGGPYLFGALGNLWGDARAPSRLDADGGRARPDRRGRHFTELSVGSR